MAKSTPAAAEPKVLDFRNPNASLFRKLLQIVFSFIMIHYLFWGVAAAALLWYIWTLGPLGIVLVVTAVMLYLPAFLKPVQVQCRDSQRWQ